MFTKNMQKRDKKSHNFPGFVTWGA